MATVLSAGESEYGDVELEASKRGRPGVTCHSCWWRWGGRTPHGYAVERDGCRRLVCWPRFDLVKGKLSREPELHPSSQQPGLGDSSSTRTRVTEPVFMEMRECTEMLGYRHGSGRLYWGSHFCLGLSSGCLDLTNKDRCWEPLCVWAPLQPLPSRRAPPIYHGTGAVSIRLIGGWGNTNGAEKNYAFSQLPRNMLRKTENGSPAPSKRNGVGGSQDSEIVGKEEVTEHSGDAELAKKHGQVALGRKSHGGIDGMLFICFSKLP